MTSNGENMILHEMCFSLSKCYPKAKFKLHVTLYSPHVMSFKKAYLSWYYETSWWKSLTMLQPHVLYCKCAASAAELN